MKECQKCKTILEDDELFCHECGTKQEIEEAETKVEAPKGLEGKKCVHCGEVIESDSFFCPFCGANQHEQHAKTETTSEVEMIVEQSKEEPIESEDVQTDEQESAKSPLQEEHEFEEQPIDKEREKKIRTWIWILLVLLIIAGAGWYFFNDVWETTSKVKDTKSSTERAESNNTVIESEEDNATPPTIQELGMMFSSITKNEKILDYGFKLIDKKSKSDDDEVYGDYTIYKEIYEKYYKIGDSGKDGQMTIECVYSPTYGDPSMTLKCDTETWNYMKNTAKNTMKELSPNYFFLNEYAYIGFTNTNIITITSECSISW